MIVKLLVDELQLPLDLDDVLTVLYHFFLGHYINPIMPPRFNPYAITSPEGLTRLSVRSIFLGISTV